MSKLLTNDPKWLKMMQNELKISRMTQTLSKISLKKLQDDSIFPKNDLKLSKIILKWSEMTKKLPKKTQNLLKVTQNDPKWMNKVLSHSFTATEGWF